MRAAPDDLDEERLRRALREWGIDAASLTYAPVGFGDHHWIAAGEGGRRFLTVADLRLKGGPDTRATLRALRSAMDTAAALPLDFVVAPLRAAGGRTVLPLGARYALSVFPFADGVAEDAEWTADDRGAVLDLLATLHRQPPPPSAPVLDLGLPARGLLEDALDGRIAWGRGPFGERARALFATHAPVLRRTLREFDRLAGKVAGGDGARVLTHGEPHPGNVLRGPDGLLVVDWDTVGVAPPERDLWSVAETPEDLERYAEAAGRAADSAALALYRLRWDLDEASVSAAWFRAPHERSPDADETWDNLVEAVERLAVTPAR
jgi:spectinomycin phosphotransferase